jgi:beta-ureidopropionase / N-carbamoyl-L-amino-acid hydrolase
VAAQRVISAGDLEARLAGLDAVGRDGDGWTRLAWTDEDAAAGDWFAEQAAAAGLRVERDPAGNRWAVPAGEGPWWATGSHMDTVRQGGRYDGALGVAAGFAVAAAVDVPVAVISFADEEGARFNTPTFGSRALAGRLDLSVLERADADGVVLRAAMDAAGMPAADVSGATAWRDRLRGFLELHIDQSRDVFAAGAPFGVVSGLAARVRVVGTFHGRADHAGTTPLDDRADALLAAARVIVRAHELARERPGMRATAGRLLVEPNAPTTVPALARLWLDARAPDPTTLDSWLAALPDAPDAHGAAPLEVQSRSDGVRFDPRVREALGGAPEFLCFAGHDAGILAEHLPAGMLLVRNEAGTSHAPDEHVELADAAAAATALARALERLA